MIRDAIYEAETSGNATIWGLTPVELHDRFWAARGVQVVRVGEPSVIVDGAELFLLTDPRLLTVFRLRMLVDRLSWLKPDVFWIRISDKRDRGYREKIVADTDNRFLRFEREYGGSDSRLARVAITSNPSIARLWQSAPDARTGWRQLRKAVPSVRRTAASIAGRAYDREADAEVIQFVRDLVETWKRPDTTVERAQRINRAAWGDMDARVNHRTEFVGPVWVGAGREIPDTVSVVGPSVLWDDPESRPTVEAVKWDSLEPTKMVGSSSRPRQRSAIERQGKRVFDLMVSAATLILLLPFAPLVMLAIWLEDGRPFFFIHRRETVGGQEFPCLKFRSMRKDADQIKARYADENKADGPQFYIADDPRLTRVGRVLRKLHIDELPQFVNVFMGHMSLVGPRPSPFKENQYCPPWREARLSVRPGITGLWQVRRTRQKGLDFQEWIRYDIEYVEKGNFFLDLKIIWKTLCLYFKKQ